MGRLPALVECPYCGKKFARSRIKNIDCVFCRRRFQLWQAKMFYRRNNHVVEIYNPDLVKHIKNIREKYEKCPQG